MKVKKRKHKKLDYAMFDFKKAYDSIDSHKLIEVIAKYDINIRIIEILVQM